MVEDDYVRPPRKAVKACLRTVFWLTFPALVSTSCNHFLHNNVRKDYGVFVTGHKVDGYISHTSVQQGTNIYDKSFSFTKDSGIPFSEKLLQFADVIR